MRTYFMLVFVIVLGVSTSSFAQGAITVQVRNDTSDNLIVNVYDRNSPQHMLVSNAIIYGNSSIPISLVPDSSGVGHLAWTAVTVDRDMRTCGHSDNPGLNDGDTVQVSAGGSCPGP
jgi:hypothetical protein